MNLYRDNAQVNRSEMLRGALVLESHPRTVVLGLTTHCNLNCIMCSSRFLTQRDLSMEILDRLNPVLQGAETVAWSEAGELLACPSVREYLKLMGTLRPRESRFSTNFVEADRYLEELLDAGLTELSISIDATTRKTYETIRRGASWDRLIENIRLFNKRKQERNLERPTLTLVYVVMRRNTAEMQNLVEFALEHNVSKIVLLRLLPTRDSRFFADERLDAETEKRSYLNLRDACVEAGITLQDGHCNAWDMVDDSPQGKLSQAATCSLDHGDSLVTALDKRREICPAPWSEFLVQTDGRVRPSCFRPQILGDLRHQSFEEIWNGEAFQDFRRQIFTQDFSQCTGCPMIDKYTHPMASSHEQVGSLVRSFRVQENNKYAEKQRLLRVKTVARAAAKRLHIARSQGRSATGEIRCRLDLESDLVKFAAARHEQAQRECDVYLAAMKSLAAGCLVPLGIHDLQLRYSDADHVFYNAGFLSHDTPARMARGRVYHVSVEIVNSSFVNWPSSRDGCDYVALTYSWLNADYQEIRKENPRTIVPEWNGPFRKWTLTPTVETYPLPGRYVLCWDLVYERHAWFKDKGISPVYAPVVVE